MFFRLSISLFLLGVGIGSPWLAQDWLGSRTDRNGASRVYTAFCSLSDTIKSKIDGDTGAIQVASAKRDPSRSASQTKRNTQGFYPPSAAAGSVDKIPSFSTASVPSTPRSQAITKETGKRLRSELTALGLAMGDPVFLRAFKEESELELWMKGAGDPHYSLFKVFRLAKCSGGPGPKLREGDRQVPEGFYSGTAASLRPETRHHLGLDLGYPNNYDAYQGHTGSELMIHGGKTSAGAFVLPREGIDEVYTLAEAGIKAGQKAVCIHLFPFRMTDGRMDKVWNRQPQWLDFWLNLKEGYDFFENVRLPPDVQVEAGRYVFQIVNR